jgi:hypothetical protein
MWITYGNILIGQMEPIKKDRLRGKQKLGVWWQGKLMTGYYKLQGIWRTDVAFYRRVKGMPLQNTPAWNIAYFELKTLRRYSF